MSDAGWCMLPRSEASYPSWMLRPHAHPVNVHYEIQDAGGALVGAALFGCPVAARDLGDGLAAAFPAIGALKVVEVESRVTIARTVRVVGVIR